MVVRDPGLGPEADDALDRPAAARPKRLILSYCLPQLSPLSCSCGRSGKAGRNLSRPRDAHTPSSRPSSEHGTSALLTSVQLSVVQLRMVSFTRVQFRYVMSRAATAAAREKGSIGVSFSSEKVHGKLAKPCWGPVNIGESMGQVHAQISWDPSRTRHKPRT